MLGGKNCAMLRFQKLKFGAKGEDVDFSFLLMHSAHFPKNNPRVLWITFCCFFRQSDVSWLWFLCVCNLVFSNDLNSIYLSLLLHLGLWGFYLFLGELLDFPYRKSSNSMACAMNEHDLSV